jgi:hypothetical protein
METITKLGGRELIAGREWIRSTTLDAAGEPWHVSKSGQVLPVVVKVRGELVHLAGNARPYFSVTGEVYNPRSRRNGGDGCIMAGCIHDIAVHYFPAVAPVVAVHLADDNGVPMHAAANAAYWAGLTKYQPADLATLARHLRLPEIETEDIARWVWNFYGDNPDAFDAVTTPAAAMLAAFEEFGLPERWQTDAARALAVLRREAVQA